MKNKIFCLFILLNLNLAGQSYSYEQIEDSIYGHFAKKFGPEVMKYMQVEPEFEYDFKTWLGFDKFGFINPEEKIETKGLKSIWAFVNFNHPDLKIYDYKIFFPVDLGPNLFLKNEIDSNLIPKYILQNKPCNWLSPLQIDSLSLHLNFTTKGENITKELRKINYYYWMVENRYQSDKGITSYETFLLNPVTGDIIKHYFREVPACPL